MVRGLLGVLATFQGTMRSKLLHKNTNIVFSPLYLHSHECTVKYSRGYMTCDIITGADVRIQLSFLNQTLMRFAKIIPIVLVKESIFVK